MIAKKREEVVGREGNVHTHTREKGWDKITLAPEHKM